MWSPPKVPESNATSLIGSTSANNTQYYELPCLVRMSLRRHTGVQPHSAIQVLSLITLRPRKGNRNAYCHSHSLVGDKALSSWEFDVALLGLMSTKSFFSPWQPEIILRNQRRAKHRRNLLYPRFGHIDEAIKVLHSIQDPNVFSWKILLRAFCDDNYVSGEGKTFDSLQDDGDHIYPHWAYFAGRAQPGGMPLVHREILLNGCCPRDNGQGMHFAGELQADWRCRHGGVDEIAAQHEKKPKKCLIVKKDQIPGIQC
ncbi:hypothetical protein SELMODRAFT_421570 [Selaginella moellendorffii]|uniref:Uncharacterized protein n=1 Tax=Selaginella moellendorffii TaxID=88036 RepID=D8SFP1_SELML|nr:hypothetical protein SELMODRAFT_421570 [Selaginella moellendorffii]